LIAIDDPPGAASWNLLLTRGTELASRASFLVFWELPSLERTVGPVHGLLLSLSIVLPFRNW
jgi:hypothetical protein